MSHKTRFIIGWGGGNGICRSMCRCLSTKYSSFPVVISYKIIFLVEIIGVYVYVVHGKLTLFYKMFPNTRVFS